MDDKTIQMFSIMIDAGLIAIPKSVSKKTRNLIEKHYGNDVKALSDALISRDFAKEKGAGHVALLEACRWVVYGNDKCPHCGK